MMLEVLLCAISLKMKMDSLQPSFKKDYERTMTMILLKDVKPGCYGELPDVSQHAKTAKEMDVAILTSEGHDKGLEMILLFSPFFC